MNQTARLTPAQLNPEFTSSLPPDQREAAQPIFSVEKKRPAPRVWTVFVALVSALAIVIFSQVTVAIVMSAWYAVRGVDPAKLGETVMGALTSVPGFIGIGLLSQFILGMAGIVPAMLSRQSTLSRLGLNRAKLSGWGYPVVTLGAVLPGAAGIIAACLLAEVIPPDSSVAELFGNMTIGWAVPFVLFIALAPGFMEEILFRGYLQRRLLQRWNPCFAILVSSSLFALFHITPHAIALAFIVGIWLGILAWRTDSIWPGIACHAFINGSLNVWRLGAMYGAWSATPSLTFSIIAITTVVVCFAVSVWLMVKASPKALRRRRPLKPTPSPSGFRFSPAQATA